METARNFLSVRWRLSSDGKVGALLQKKHLRGRDRVAATNGIFAMKLRNFYVFVNE